jgi:hypothetical protein
LFEQAIGEDFHAFTEQHGRRLDHSRPSIEVITCGAPCHCSASGTRPQTSNGSVSRRGTLTAKST